MTNSPHFQLQLKGTSLSGKVLALALLPFVASLGFMCVLLSLSDSVVRATEREKTAELALAECNSLSFAMIKSGIELAELTLEGEAGNTPNFDRTKRELPNVTERLKKVGTLDPELAKIAADIDSTGKVMIKLSNEAVGLIDLAGPDIAFVRLNELRNLVKASVIRMAELFTLYAKDLDAHVQNAPGGSELLRMTMLKAVIAGVVSIGLLTSMTMLLMSRSFAKRLEILSKNSELLAEEKPLLLPLSGDDEICEVDSKFHQMASKLAISRHREALAVSNSVDVICTLSGDLHFQQANPACERLWGISVSDLIGQSVLDVCSSDEKTLNECFALAQRAEFAEFAIDSKRHHASEASDAIVTLWIVVWSKEENSYFCVVHDVTEQSGLEDELNRNRERLQKVFAGMPAGVLVVDSSNTVTFANEKASELLSYQTKEIVGQPVTRFIDEVVQKNSGAADPAPISTSAKDANDKLIAIELITSSLSAESGETLLAFLDVREREDVKKLRNELISMMVNDISNPLNLITSAFSEVKGRIDTDSKVNRDLSVLVKEMGRLTRLFDELIDIATFDKGDLQISKELRAIDEIVIASAESFQFSAANKGIELDTICEPAQALIDSDRIMRVLSNLISNALKFSPASTVIEIRGSVNEGTYIITVADRGPGIPEDLMAVIFEPFRQVNREDSLKHGGTGLGLSICMSIVELHSGSITVRNRNDCGAEFRIELPLG